MRLLPAFSVLALAALAAANQVSLTPTCIGHTCTGWSNYCGSAPITFLDEDNDAVPVPEAAGHTLLAFDLASQIPAGSRITAAVLHFNVSAFFPGPVELRAITTSWTCGTVAWSGPGEGTGIPAGPPLATSSMPLNACTFSSSTVTAWAQSTIDLPSSNHGLLLMPPPSSFLLTEAYINTGSIALDVTWDPPCPAPVNYCIGAPNSVGPGARISISGSTRISDNAMTIVATGMRPGASAFCFFGGAQQLNPLGNGWLCVDAPIYRLLPGLFADANGAIARPVNFHVGTAQNITSGSTWNFQVEYRDVHGGGAGFNLSDAVAVTFCP